MIVILERNLRCSMSLHLVQIYTHQNIAVICGAVRYRKKCTVGSFNFNYNRLNWRFLILGMLSMEDVDLIFFQKFGLLKFEIFYLRYFYNSMTNRSIN